MSENDLPYAYDLFNRITNNATVNGQPLGSLLLDGTYNLWHCLSQAAFLEECVAFSRTKRFEPMSNRTFSPKYFFVGGFAFVVTLVALIGIRFGPKRVLVYSVDRISPRGAFDFRMEKVYQELAMRKVTYVEVLHTVIGKRFVKNLFTRGRPAIYLEGLEWSFYLVRSLKRLVAGRTPTVVIGGLDSCTDDERTFAQALVTKFVSIAPLLRYRAGFLTTALKGRISVVFSIDDARHYHEVMIAAARLGIRSYAFQHSHVTPYHVGWLQGSAYRGEYARADYFVAWNEYWKDELFALHALWPEDEIIIAGSPKERSVFAAKRAVSGMPRVVVIPYETDGPASVVQRVIARLRECADVKVVLKLRPDLPRDTQMAFFGAVPESVRVITAMTELAEPVTAVLGTYSTFLYDAAEAGLPVGLIKTNLQYTKRMVLNGLADEVTIDGVCAAVDRLAALTQEQVAFRQKILASSDQLSTVIGDILAQTGAVG